MFKRIVVKLCLIDPKKCKTHKTNSVKVKKYQEDLVKGALFPPIEALELKDGTYAIKDGNHRTEAHRALNELIWAYVFEYDDYPSQWLLGSRLGKNFKL